MNELQKAKIEPRPGGSVEAPDPSELIDLEVYCFVNLHIVLLVFVCVQSRLELLETEVKEINTNQETLKRNMLDLIELRHILLKTQIFFEQVIFLNVLYKFKMLKCFTIG